MKIVVIAGWIHPHISARAFRATELAKGFAKQGHDVTLYAILGKYDYSTFEKDYKVKVKSLGRSWAGNNDSDGFSKKNILQRILTRLLYRTIDYPRCEYFFKTVKALKREDHFDYLITIANPYGIHWGAAFYKKYCRRKKFDFWASDCGDPFLGVTNTTYHEFLLRPLENLWGKQTDKIVIPIEEAKKGYDSKFQDKIEVIPQSIDFSSVKINTYQENSIPNFLYSGAIYPGKREPYAFLDYLCTLDLDFRFHMHIVALGNLDKYKSLLGEKLEIHPYIPREDLILKMSTMDFLVNIKNKSNLQSPSKLIDYSLSKRPILSISSNFNDDERSAFEDFLSKDYSHQTIVEGVEKFDSKNVCKNFCDLYVLCNP